MRLSAIATLFGAIVPVTNSTPTLLRRGDHVSLQARQSTPNTLCQQLGNFLSPLSSSRFSKTRARADDMYGCLSSVAFNSDNGLTTLDSVTRLAELLPSLAYLKDATFMSQYNLDSIDVIGELQRMVDDVKNNKYSSELQFEIDIAKIFLRTKDLHNWWLGNLLAGVARWSRPLDFSLQRDLRDGDPKIFMAADLQRDAAQASAIVKINGMDAVEFLLQDASLNTPYHDRHAAYNSMFRSSVVKSGAEVDGSFINPIFYPGPLTNLTLENGTIISKPNLAIPKKQSDWQGILNDTTTYAKWVAAPQTSQGISRRSDAEVPINSEDFMATTLHNVSARDDTGLQTLALHSDSDEFDIGGYSVPLTGRPDALVGILKVHTFTDKSTETQRVATDFVAQCRSKGIKKIIIDIRSNHGGYASRVLEIIAALSPQKAKSIFCGLRIRVGASGNLLGQVSKEVKSVDDISNPIFDYRWYHKPDNKAYTSWSEFWTPVPAQGDSFTPTSSFYFNQDQFSGSTWLRGEDITILSNGMCDSACSMFLYWLKGAIPSAHFITTGGIPGDASVMTPSGGSRSGTTFSLADIVAWFDSIKSSADPALFAQYSVPLPPIRVFDASIAVTDNMLSTTSNVPMQFTPLASECRLPDTLAYTDDATLYKDVYAAVWGLGVSGGDKSKCLPGSVPQTESAGCKKPQASFLTNMLQCCCLAPSAVQP